MKTRRKRPVPDDWATGDVISSYTTRTTSKPLQQAANVFSLHEAGDLVLVGGAEGDVDIYSVSENQVQQSLKAGGGSITGAVWVGNRVALSTSKGKVLVFSPLTDGEVGTFDAHTGSATAVTVHASGELLASVGEDRTYAIYDLKTMNALSQVPTSSSQ